MPHHEMSHHERYILADWPAPAHIKAFVTTRRAGLSKGVFSSFNMGLYSGDDPSVVQQNRQLLVSDWQLPGAPHWLKQVHGVDVVQAQLNGQEQEVDASFSTTPGVACVALAADCLPVLFTDKAGTVVAAAHAGWKGLASGVLEETVLAMKTPASDIMAWLGPAIGPDHFEVGPEVRERFVSLMAEASTAFKPGEGDRWYADIYELARLRLQKLGICDIYGGGFCTVSQSDLFFSYRRDGKASGRMAAGVWITV